MWDALLQYHFKVDADELDEDKYLLYIARLQFALVKTGQWKS